MNGHKLILSLCDYSGSWSRPYADGGYQVLRVDMDHPAGMVQTSDNVWTLGCNLVNFDFSEMDIYGVLAAPPCTTLCRPGAQHWFRMDFTRQTDRDAATFRACMRIAKQATAWWAIENPPGRHAEVLPELERPAWQFQPWEYGDPWTKQTYIWGTAKKPDPCNQVVPAPMRRTPNGKTQGRIAFLSGSSKREREKTPPGFAIAFYNRNP